MGAFFHIKPLTLCERKRPSLFMPAFALRTAERFYKITEFLDLGTWNGCIRQLVGNLPVQKLSRLEKDAEALKKAAPLHGLLLNREIHEKRLIRGFPAGNDLIRELSEYSRCVLSYYKSQYREEMFTGKEGAFLPPDCRFALYVSEALENMEYQRFPAAVSLFRSALRFYPAMTGVIQEIIRQMKNSMDNPAANAGEEFQQLAAQMKESLLSLAEAGRYDEAVSIMGHLSPLLPEDLELLRIRQNLLRKTMEPKADALSILK